MSHDTSGNTGQADQLSTQLEEGLFHYLSGYGKERPGELEQVIRYPHWQARARVELDRRMGELAEQLDIQTLIAIAEGQLDIAQIAKRVQEEQ